MKRRNARGLLPLARRLTKRQMVKRLYWACWRAAQRGIAPKWDMASCTITVLGRTLTDVALEDLRVSR
jgi:hypothetical protein